VHSSPSAGAAGIQKQHKGQLNMKARPEECFFSNFSVFSHFLLQSEGCCGACCRKDQPECVSSFFSDKYAVVSAGDLGL